jgi:hypothetical protein
MLNPRYHSINLVALNFIVKLLIIIVRDFLCSACVRVVTTKLPRWGYTTGSMWSDWMDG